MYYTTQQKEKILMSWFLGLFLRIYVLLILKIALHRQTVSALVFEIHLFESREKVAMDTTVTIKKYLVSNFKIIIINEYVGSCCFLRRTDLKIKESGLREASHTYHS